MAHKYSIFQMRYSKRARPSMIKSRCSGATSVTMSPTDLEILRTSLEQQSLNNFKLRETKKWQQELLASEHNIQKDIKNRIMQLTDSKKLEKYRIAFDPLFFASSKIDDTVRHYILKIVNTILKVGKDSKQASKQAEKTLQDLQQSIRKLNELEQNWISLRAKHYARRLELSTSLTVQSQKAQLAQTAQTSLSAQIFTLQAQLNLCQKELSQRQKDRLRLESKLSDISETSCKLSQQIDNLRENSDNQNELVRRRLLLELTEKEQKSLQEEIDFELVKRNQLLKELEYVNCTLKCPTKNA